MDTMLVWAIIIVGGIILYKIIRIFSASIPNASKDVIEKFKEKLPPGFAYPYYLDATGYALNVEEGKILLIYGSFLSPHACGIYDRSQVRDMSWKMDGWEYTHDYRPLAALDNAANKREAQKTAYKNSGIFVQVADIDHPKWQIRFSSMPLLERNFEILTQFMEGRLPAPKSIQK